MVLETDLQTMTRQAKRIAELEESLSKFTRLYVDSGARVDELEAELEYHGFNPHERCAGKDYHPTTDDLEARAENAEAEVERLRADCRAHTRNHRVPGHTHPEPCCLADYPGFHCDAGVNPSGDTLGQEGA